MEMMIGGAFQGKEELAKRCYPDVNWSYGTSVTRQELFRADGVIGFHELIKRELQEGKDVSDLAQALIQENPDLIVVSDEVGYGVVPMDAFDRRYREAVGRTCTELASFSSKVTRVVCGIGTVIKE